MSQQPRVEQLLPIPPSDKAMSDGHWDYIYEPEAREVLDFVLRRYIESQIFQAWWRTSPARWRRAWWR